MTTFNQENTLNINFKIFYGMGFIVSDVENIKILKTYQEIILIFRDGFYEAQHLEHYKYI